MELTIHNLAKIHHANLKLNGVSLICGANDSGKSTCGKALCALVNAFTQLKERSMGIRCEKLRQVIGLVLKTTIYPWEMRSLSVEKYLEGAIEVEDLLARVLEVVGAREGDDEKVDVSRVDRGMLIRKLEEIRNLPDQMFYSAAVHRCFDSAFNKQFVPLVKFREGGGGDVSSVVVADGGRSMSVSLKKDSCSLQSLDLPFPHRAWYVDDSRLVDYLSGRPPVFPNQFERNVVRAIMDGRQKDRQDPVAGAFDAVLLKGRMDRIEALFAKTLDGEIVGSGEDQFALQRNCWKEPLRLSNASMGLKGIALIRMMLDARMLEEGDILILDEPEVHLHPDWQLVCAELVVLLNKDLHVKVLLTTHSPDFIRAVQLFSRKYDVVPNAYLSNGSEQVTIDEVRDWGDLFARFVPMIDQLDRMDAEFARREGDNEA